MANRHDKMDSQLISLREEYEVRYWTQALGATQSEILEAIDTVGRGARQVREYLTQHRG